LFHGIEYEHHSQQEFCRTLKAPRQTAPQLLNDQQLTMKAIAAAGKDEDQDVPSQFIKHKSTSFYC
jgi:hypothetical protein